MRHSDRHCVFVCGACHALDVVVVNVCGATLCGDWSLAVEQFKRAELARALAARREVARG